MILGRSRDHVAWLDTGVAKETHKELWRLTEDFIWWQIHLKLCGIRYRISRWCSTVMTQETSSESSLHAASFTGCSVIRPENGLLRTLWEGITNQQNGQNSIFEAGSNSSAISFLPWHQLSSPTEEQGLMTREQHIVGSPAWFLLITRAFRCHWWMGGVSHNHSSWRTSPFPSVYILADGFQVHFAIWAAGSLPYHMPRQQLKALVAHLCASLWEPHVAWPLLHSKSCPPSWYHSVKSQNLPGAIAQIMCLIFISTTLIRRMLSSFLVFPSCSE